MFSTSCCHKQKTKLVSGETFPFFILGSVLSQQASIGKHLLEKLIHWGTLSIGKPYLLGNLSIGKPYLSGNVIDHNSHYALEGDSVKLFA